MPENKNITEIFRNHFTDAGSEQKLGSGNKYSHMRQKKIQKWQASCACVCFIDATEKKVNTWMSTADDLSSSLIEPMSREMNVAKRALT